HDIAAHDELLELFEHPCIAPMCSRRAWPVTQYSSARGRVLACATHFFRSASAGMRLVSFLALATSAIFFISSAGLRGDSSGPVSTPEASSNSANCAPTPLMR